MLGKTLETWVREQLSQGLALLRSAWAGLRAEGPGQFQFWVIALLVGIAAGFAALGFRNGIAALQAALYRTEDIRSIHSWAAQLDWWLVLGLPILGGLVVGAILNIFTDDGRVRAVADVIEGAALHDGRVEIRAGLASAVASLITLSSGGSTGREGPVVHLAGVIATWVSDRIGASGVTARDLLGCAVAAAVSASFNAPIAGALFALEVVLRHFAMRAFAPIVIASAAGTVISRLQYGNVTEFTLPAGNQLEFYVELPAYLILGLVCGLAATLMMRSIFWADGVGTTLQRAIGLPAVLRPALAGALLGAIALVFPQIIGVGYETVSQALTGQLLLWEAIVLAMVKTVAVAITMAGRMGGGVFSPSLMVGALTGLAFGYVATGIFPDVSGAETLYALAGMGALAAAVLGAPISTTLIVFELTGDWQTGLAVMVAVSTSTALASRLVDRSFFLTQLAQKGAQLASGRQDYLLAVYRVDGAMRPLGGPDTPPPETLREAMETGHSIAPEATLDAALPRLERAPTGVLAVVRTGGATAAPEILGALHLVDALRLYNRALAAAAAEEHA